MIRYLVIVLFVMYTSSFADTIIFQDNFDNHADWTSPVQNYSDGSDDSDSTGDFETRCTSCPQDGAIYSGMYSARAAWSDYRGNETLSINSANARGGTGKALTMWMEPVNSSSCDGGTYW